MGESQTEFRGRVTILSDGGLESLAACAAARESILASGQANSPKPVVWPTTNPGVTALARHRAIERQAAIFDLELAPAGAVAATKERSSPAGLVGSGELQTRDLIAASFGSLRLGSASLVWPARAASGDDVALDNAARIADRALLVSRLVAMDAMDHGAPGFVIETPYVDLTDRQIADLVLDMDLPIQLCWWWSETALAARESADPGDETAIEADRRLGDRDLLA